MERFYEVNFEFVLLLFAFTLGCQSSQKIPEDKFIWLEEIEGEKQLTWVKDKNKQTMQFVESDKRFEEVKQDLIDIYTADDRIPMPSYDGQYVSNFWRDKKNVRGLWRRTTRSSYRKRQPKWETVLDIDKLSKDENENWVYKGRTCLPPKFELCLLRLSRGGTDASVIREFNTKTKKFVKDGFQLKQAKSNYSWYDENHLLVGTDFGEGTLTESGYPYIMKLWKRGTPLSEAKQLYQGEKKDVIVSSRVYHFPEGHFSMISNYKSFMLSKKFRVNSDLSLQEIPIPEDSEIDTVFEDRLIVKLRSSWNEFGTGAIVSVELSETENGQLKAKPQLLFQPKEGSTVNYVSRSQKGVFVNLSENVMGKVLFAKPTDLGWEMKT
ncbi:MAG: S9 family peptidase, partial [Pseudomonadota bacterium]